ncbi:MAG: hypothetical protein J6O04_09765 [Selenomonadaceae bacterium]|nr:hypothetical protein [Selenomonadaceae bacterium]
MENYPDNSIVVSSISENSENNNQAPQNALVPYEPEVLQREQLALAQQQQQTQQEAQVVSNQVSMNYVPNYQQTAPYYLGNIACADINLKQAQDLNHKRYAAWIELNAYHAKKEIDFEFEVRRQMMIARSYTQFSPQMNPCATVTRTLPTLDRNTVLEFLKIHEAVRLDRTYGEAYKFIWTRDKSLIRHIIVRESEFCIEFEDYIFDNFPAYEEITQTVIERLKRMLVHSIPKLSVSGLEVIEENNVVFPNGTFDLISGIFHERNMVRVFNRFSLLYDFNKDAPNPDNFDKILSDISGGNTDIVTRAYEIIGALISPLARLKLIFVFQGASHGGKTKLAELICLLLNELGVRVVNDISEVTTEIKLEEGLQTQLLYMQDAPDKKITAKQASFLKTFAGGNTLNQSAKFKLLICTNGALHTGDGGYLPQSLLNRLTVLPFPRAMTLDFDEYRENYFEQERMGIVKKSLEAFHRVLISGGKFTGDFSINKYIEKPVESAELSDDELSRLHSALSEMRDKLETTKLSKVLDELFVIADKVNQDINAQTVFNMVNDILPEQVKNVAVMGRCLANHFGDRLRSEKIGQKMCYNLDFRKSNE